MARTHQPTEPALFPPSPLERYRGRHHRKTAAWSEKSCRKSEIVVQATLLTNPIWVLKTRFQLQERRGLLAASSKKALRTVPSKKGYHSLRHAVRTIAHEEGIRGFYRGLGPSLLMVLISLFLTLCNSTLVQCANAAVQFAVYEELRRLVMYFVDDDASLPSGAAFVIGGISKATATLVTYPTQVSLTLFRLFSHIASHRSCDPDCNRDSTSVEH